MVPWWSLPIALLAGGVFAMIIIALVSVNDDDDQNNYYE